MKGVYILLIFIKKNILAKIGALGNLEFTKGTYAYIGSAQNNLQKRVKRHLRKNKKFHWHVDYLLKNKNTEIKKILTKKSGKKEECRTAQRLSEISEPIIGFGCSDCKCKSHLFKIKDLNAITKMDFSQK